MESFGEAVDLRARNGIERCHENEDTRILWQSAVRPEATVRLSAVARVIRASFGETGHYVPMLG